MIVFDWIDRMKQVRIGNWLNTNNKEKQKIKTSTYKNNKTKYFNDILLVVLIMYLTNWEGHERWKKAEKKKYKRINGQLIIRKK
jgi:hypothetical protein